MSVRTALAAGLGFIAWAVVLFILLVIAWKHVPPDIIHWDESAPDGKPTLFALSESWGGWPPGTPTCFYPPPGGL
jgi:hypothetical protein